MQIGGYIIQVKIPVGVGEAVTVSERPLLNEMQLKAMTRRELLDYAQRYGIEGINRHTLKGIMIDTILKATNGENAQ